MAVQNLSLQIVLVLFLIKASTPEAAFSEFRKCSVSEKCGEVSIPYPFGIEQGCFFSEWFRVTCNNASGSPKPYISSINLELLDVDLSNLTVRVNIPAIFSSNCVNTRRFQAIDLRGSPFSFSDTHNRFTAVGCDNFANMIRRNNSIIGGCLSICASGGFTASLGCFGLNCCQTTIPPSLTYFNASISSVISSENQDCRSAFMVDYREDPFALRDREQVPAVLEWGRNRGTCFEGNSTIVPACNGEYPNDYCSIPLDERFLCHCDGISSNMEQGCQGRLVCLSGAMNCSGCPDGSLTFKDTCYPMYPNINTSDRKSPEKFIIIGCSAGFGTLLLLIGAWWLYKLVKRRRAIKLKQKFFKRNGGLLLQKQFSSSTEGSIDKTKLFTSKELENATDNYNTNRILGQGGQGTVYKGMLADGRIVAVKKSKIVDESKLDHFINEVVILSQINHRNVVKLLGCCLETQVPLLVYEFIPNGTLFQYIHSNQIDELPMMITWEMRLRIAIEVAGALSYLHSAASIPIYHRDIKSTNILLDEKYRGKVSDFGTSRSVAVDQTHLTTQVQGTFGYLDPEYFRSSQFTEKSDVYSFGVVLVELLTGQKPIRTSTNPEEYASLAAYFLQAMEENRLFEIFDARVVEEGNEKEIITAAKLAQRCLNLNGKKRPTMGEVAIELAGIRAASNGVGSTSVMEQDYEEIDFVDGDIITRNFETDSSYNNTGSTTVLIDVQPLISNN